MRLASLTLSVLARSEYRQRLLWPIAGSTFDLFGAQRSYRKAGHHKYRRAIKLRQNYQCMVRVAVLTGNPKWVERGVINYVA